MLNEKMRARELRREDEPPVAAEKSPEKFEQSPHQCKEERKRGRTQLMLRRWIVDWNDFETLLVLKGAKRGDPESTDIQK